MKINYHYVRDYYKNKTVANYLYKKIILFSTVQWLIPIGGVLTELVWMLVYFNDFGTIQIK